MLNYKGHIGSFGLAFTVLAMLNYYLEWGLPPRGLCGILVIPWLNPDIDQALDPESHRFFLSHSMIPAVLFWYCFLEVVPEYAALIFLIGGFYPWIHLIGDLGGVQGFGLISLYPYIRFKGKSYRWERNKNKEIIEKKVLNWTWYRLSRARSYLWIVGNIIFGVILLLFLLSG